MIAALRKLGYVAGQNLAVDIRYADGNVDQLPRLARGLRLRSAPRLVIRLPRTPPRRGVGPARAGGGHPPKSARQRSLACAIDPEICLGTTWTTNRLRSIPA